MFLVKPPHFDRLPHQSNTLFNFQSSKLYVICVNQAWHGRQRQRATRQEKLRFQALKSDDQEAYMKMVEESKNERLTMLLGKTNELLVRLGAAVRRQKDAEHDGIEPLAGPQPSVPTPEAVVDVDVDEEGLVDDTQEDNGVKTSDLLEGQRQYNSVIHSIQEKVLIILCILYIIRICKRLINL